MYDFECILVADKSICNYLARHIPGTFTIRMMPSIHVRPFLLTALLLFTVCISVSAQKKILFKQEQKPESTYQTSYTQGMEMVLKMEGNKKFQQELKKQGAENPMVKKIVFALQTKTKTGKLTNNQFPLTIEYVSVKSSEGSQIIPEGTVVYGHGSPTTLPVLDSIPATNLSEETKQSILQFAQKMLSQVQYPEKEVAVGEKITQDNTLNLPVADMQMEMMLTTTYKLVRIEGNQAFFDIEQVYRVKSTNTEYQIKASGNGKGKMIFDITNFFSPSYQVSNSLKMNLKKEDIELNITIQASSSVVSTLEK